MLEVATTEDELREYSLRAVASWNSSDLNDIYAISFLLETTPGDRTRLALYVSCNTLSQWRSQIGGTAADDEVKWNFAFWLQNISAIITYSKGSGAIGDDKQFVLACVAVAKSVQQEALLLSSLGKMVPIIIHTFGYSQEDIDHTIEANPPDLIAEFVAYEP